MTDSKQDHKQHDRPAYTEDGIRIYYNYGEYMDENGWCYIGGKMQPLRIVNLGSDPSPDPVQLEPTKKIKPRKRCM
jgi:hypothetical protein